MSPGEDEATPETARSNLAVLLGELVAARRSRTLSQRRLSARLGLTEIVVGRWEAGTDLPSTDNLVRWSHELGYSLAILDPAGRLIAEAPTRAEQEAFEAYELRRLAAALRRARTEGGFTQKALSAALGISEWTTMMWESGQRQPRILHLISWADRLGCRLVLIEQRDYPRS